MSRTLHHVRYNRWNVKELDPYWGYSDDQYEKVGNGRRMRRLKPGATPGWVPYMHAVGVELYDLRFYAGCQRVPQQVHRRRDYYSYVRIWGHANGVARSYAKEAAGSHRASVRAYGRDIVKAYRCGGDLEEYVEPEGRTRHNALWEAC